MLQDAARLTRGEVADVDVEPAPGAGVGRVADARAVGGPGAEVMDVVGVVGERFPGRARLVQQQELRVLVAADVTADDQLAGTRARMDRLRPIGRRQQQLRPALTSHAPDLRHAAQVADEDELPARVEAARRRRARPQKLPQVEHLRTRLARLGLMLMLVGRPRPSVRAGDIVRAGCTTRGRVHARSCHMRRTILGHIGQVVSRGIAAFALAAGAVVGPAATSAAAAPSTCHFLTPTGTPSPITHVIHIQFDNVHFRRDNPDVPSDLEQMPHLLNFIENKGTLFANEHTPLISHTAHDLLTGLTGLYGNQTGIPISNSFEYYNSSSLGAYNTSAFTYWTDPDCAGPCQPRAHLALPDDRQSRPQRPGAVGAVRQRRLQFRRGVERQHGAGKQWQRRHAGIRSRFT